MVIMQLIIRKGECKANCNNLKTLIDEIAVNECSSGDSVIDIQKISNLLGTKAGEL